MYIFGTYYEKFHSRPWYALTSMFVCMYKLTFLCKNEDIFTSILSLVL